MLLLMLKYGEPVPLDLGTPIDVVKRDVVKQNAYIDC